MNVDQICSSKCIEGDLAHLQTHKDVEGEGPLQGPDAPEEAAAGYPPVRCLPFLTFIIRGKMLLQVIQCFSKLHYRFRGSRLLCKYEMCGKDDCLLGQNKRRKDALSIHVLPNISPALSVVCAA